jgi:hypothetical protein
MKRIIYTFVLLTFGLLVQAQTQYPLNGSFEDWSTGSFAGVTYDSVDYWDTPQRLGVALAPGDTVVFQSDVAQEGNFSALLNTKEVNIAGLLLINVPGTLTTGTIFVDILATPPEFGVLGGSPIDCRPEELSFWYQNAPVGGDSANIQLYLTRWNGTSRDTLYGTDQISIDATVSTWTEYTYAIDYGSTTETPDTVQLTFLSSGLEGMDGSQFWVDNVKLQGGDCFTGIFDAPAPVSALDLAPNPATSQLRIDFPEAQSAQAKVMDLTGRVYQLVELQPGVNQLDINALPAGMYIIDVAQEGVSTYRGRFEKQ